MSDFGDNLKAVRAKKGISQGDLAETLGTHPTHVSRYERGQASPTVEVVRRIADALSVSADDLVYGMDGARAGAVLADAELLDLFNRVQGMTHEDIKTVKNMLKAFAFQKDMQKQLAR